MNVALHTIRIGSFCAGVEGLGLGVKIALRRSRIVVLCERDSYAAATLVARMEGAALDQAPIWDRVDTFPADDFHGCLDLLIAGYPCQPFSVAGKRAGEADPRHLWPHIKGIIARSRPPFVFLENVAGHLRLGFGPKTAVEEALQQSASVRADLRKMGYRVTAGIFTAEEAGAPHERKRLFILAYRTRRGLRELRQSLWCNGFVDGRNEELGDTNLYGSAAGVSGQVNETRPGVFEHTREELGHSEGERFGEERRLRHNRPPDGHCGPSEELVADCNHRSDEPNEEIQSRRRAAVSGCEQLPHAERESFSAEWLNNKRERSASGANDGSMPGIGSAADGELEDPTDDNGRCRICGAQEATRTDDQRRRGPSVGRANVGDAGGGDLQERRSLDRDTHEEQPTTPGAGLPLFPPGRNDFESWARVRQLRPDLWPAVESGVRLLVDGPAALVDEYRGEQLRCVGNAVFPLEAALAFTTLVVKASGGQ